jgi:ketosteroid isomerase-like protein/uncharacterized protein YndB with AHSA1/START domain
MPTIHRDVRIASAPEAVWALLADLTAVPEWVPGINSARIDGMRRICTTVEGAEIHEELELDEASRTYAYSQSVHPLGLKTSRGKLAVTPNSAGSHVTWEAEVEFEAHEHEAQFLPLLEAGYAEALAGLKRVLEQRPLDLVNRFYEASATRETAALVPFVSDDVTFEGPLMRARGAREYLALNEQLLEFHRGTTMLRQFEHEDSVCSIYELTMATPSGGEVAVAMADWIETEGGRIRSQRIYFDPREFAQAFGM